MRDAAGKPPIDRVISDLYRRIDEQVAELGLEYRTSGRCCHFNTFGHLMYVTALEIAWVLHKALEPGNQEPDQGIELTALEIDPQGSCPFQIDRLCCVHAIRPMGCRIFFCQAGSQKKQRDIYERYLDELRRLYRGHDLPYHYVEWRQGLRDALNHLA